MLSRITSSFAEYSPLLSFLRSIFQSVGLRRKKPPSTQSLALSLSHTHTHTNNKEINPCPRVEVGQILQTRPPLKIWQIPLVDESATSKTGIKSES
jgi:hypothetical protein